MNLFLGKHTERGHVSICYRMKTSAVKKFSLFRCVGARKDFPSEFFINKDLLQNLLLYGTFRGREWLCLGAIVIAQSVLHFDTRNSCSLQSKRRKIFFGVKLCWEFYHFFLFYVSRTFIAFFPKHFLALIATQLKRQRTITKLNFKLRENKIK